MLIPLYGKIRFVEAPNRARFPYCHGLFIDDEIKAIIDSSFSQEDIHLLFKQGVDVIVNSHFHEDHILNNHVFNTSQVWAHHMDAPAIRSLQTFQDYYGFKQFHSEELGRQFISSIDLRPSPVHRELHDNEILDFGSVRLRVVHLPGHTPGHCGFLDEENGMLFSGDIDLSSFGPWYGHLCSDLDDFMSSIQKCLEINPPLIVTCHKGIIRENIPNLLKKYLDLIFKKEEMVMAALQQAMTLEDLASKQIFYGTRVELDPLMFWMEKLAVHIHLTRLIKLGEVKSSQGLFFLK